MKDKVYETGVKGFLHGMVCRPDAKHVKQYRENAVFKEKGGEICEAGVMHAADNAAHVLDYYPLLDDECNFCEFAPVEALEEPQIVGHKWATTKLRIGSKFGFAGFVKAFIECVIKNENIMEITEDCARIASSLNWARIASSGYAAQIASSGDRAKLASSGDRAKLASSGYEAQIASSGSYVNLASSGPYSKLANSGYAARLASSGDHTKLASSGDCARLASSGAYAKLASSGSYAVVAGIGANNIAKAKKGSWLVLAEYDEKGAPLYVKAEQVDGIEIKEDTFYKLEGKRFVEVRE